jgi:pimeloyl-ACP methyl ester carboxylesterase
MNTIDINCEQLRARSSGTGPTVLCLHSSGASGQQWQALAEQLIGMRVVRVDAHGHGQSPAPTDAPVFDLDAQALVSTLQQARDGVHLVGHSYGAALALRLALAVPRQVRSLTLFEPVLFSLLLEPGADAAAREDIVQVGRTIGLWVGMRQPARAARIFVDFWSGPGSWQRLSGRQQQTVVQRMPVIAAHFRSLIGSGVTLEHVRQLRVPTLLMSGAESRRAALALVDMLAQAWPHAELHRFAHAGHLAPMTQARTVNARIERFLAAVERRRAGEHHDAAAAFHFAHRSEGALVLA